MNSTPWCVCVNEIEKTAMVLIHAYRIEELSCQAEVVVQRQEGDSLEAHHDYLEHTKREREGFKRCFSSSILQYIADIYNLTDLYIQIYKLAAWHSVPGYELVYLLFFNS